MNKTKNTKPKIAESSEEESDSSPLLSKTKHSKKLQLQNKKVAKNQDSGQSDQEDSVLISQKKIQVSLKTQKSAANRSVNPLKRAKKQQSSEQPSDSSEEKPQKKIIKTGSAIQNAAIKKKFAKKQSSQEEQNEQLQPKKVAKGPATKTTLSLKQARKEQSESSEEQAPNKVRKLQQISKTKSPLQKTIVSNKKKQESQQSEVEDEQSQPEQEPKGTAEQKPVKVFQQIVEKKKPAVLSNEKPTVVQTQKQIDEEGQFEVCVKGLSFYALQNDIQQLFKPVGNLISVYLLTREDGKSKGIAFIKLSSKHSYNQALRLDGTQHLGRDITVQPSLSKQNPNFKKNNHLQTTAEITSATIFVGGLSFATTQQNFSAFFQQAGKVFSARIVTDKQTGKSRGFGYIQYHNIDTAKKAYQTLNNKQLDGKQLRIDNATQKDKPLGTKRGYQKIQLSQIGNNARQGSLASFRGRLEAK